MKRIPVEENFSWQRPILSVANSGTATKGYRYIVGDTPSGNFSGFSTDSIVTYTGSEWIEDIPSEGWMTYNIDTGYFIYYAYTPSGIQWINFEAGTGGGVSDASDINTDTTNFNGNLSSADNTIQKALDTIDDLTLGGTGYDDDEAQTYFATLSTALSSTQQSRISELILNIKSILGTNDLTTRFDFLYLFANETQEAAGLNIIKRSHDISEVNSPSWTQWEGYTGNGSSSYIDTNYNPSTDKVSLSLNDGSLGIYSRSSITGQTKVDMQCSSNTDTYEIGIYLKWSDGKTYGRINDNGGGITIANQTGTMMITFRNSSLYKNIKQNTGTFDLYGSVSSTTTGVPNNNITIGVANRSGGLGDWSNRQYSIAFCGGGMTKSEADQIIHAFETYMDQIGTGILP